MMFKNLVLLLALSKSAQAMPANAKSFSPTQPNGHPTGCLFQLIGNPGYHYVICEDQPVGWYTTAVNQEDGHIYYAEIGSDGRLVPGPVEIAGGIDPDAEGIEHYQVESVDVIEAKCKENEYCKWKIDNDGMSGQNPPADDYDNLVIPFFFSDHTERKIKWDALLKDVFNDDHSSVKHYFESQSFGKLAWNNLMVSPVILPFTEAYCADNVSGTSGKMHECLVKALELVVDQGTQTPSDYDGITFIHSGYGAENGNRDKYQTYLDDRIWSHSWALEDDTEIYSGRYALVSAYYGHHNEKYLNPGTAIHEIAQMLGAPTQYGPEPGNGLGNYDVLANPFGFDGDLRNCGSMSAYTRVLLEWAEVEEITEAGTYKIESSLTSNKVYKITKGFPTDEYYLIENRQNAGYDKGMRGPGLAIYHIDGTANGKPGYPGDGSYPANHYHVSLIQADGRFDLEREEDQGDMTDLFHFGGVDGITPEGALFNGKLKGEYPNTNAYSHGTFSPTGLTIRDISLPGKIMEFTVEFAESSSSQ